MLSRSQLKSLLSHRGYPSVSILAPTHRTAPANKQDRIKVKNLLRTAIDRLHGEYTKREVTSIVKKLKALATSVDWRHTLDGLVLLAGEKYSAAITLPFRVKPRVVIDETFATRDLTYAFNRAAPYRVLVLSHTTQLYDAWTTVLEERRGKPFPMVHRGRGGASKLPGGKGVNRSAVRDEAHRDFFRSVDQAVRVVQKPDPLPLVVVGTVRNLAFYQEVTSQPDMIAGLLAGNHDRTSPGALGKLVWPVFDTGATRRRTEAMVELDKAVGASRHASGIQQVWRAAVDAKCRILLVEEDFKYQADIAADGYRLLPFTGKGANSLDDAVDEVIEQVLNGGGSVYFYSPGELGVHQKIAAVLRG